MKSKYLLLFLLCSFAYIVGWRVGIGTKSMVVTVSPAAEVVKTIAHKNVENPDYELLWSDIEEDVAYYRYIGDRDLAEIGDKVYTYMNDECKIITTSLQGFTIETEVILPVGTSGTVVKDKHDNVIGYISQSIGNNQYYCIWN